LFERLFKEANRSTSTCNQRIEHPVEAGTPPDAGSGIKVPRIRKMARGNLGETEDLETEDRREREEGNIEHRTSNIEDRSGKRMKKRLLHSLSFRI